MTPYEKHVVSETRKCRCCIRFSAVGDKRQRIERVLLQSAEGTAKGDGSAETGEMIDKLSARITRQLERNSITKRENREIYEYGLERMITYSMNILTTCVLGAILGMFLESLLFSITFIFMRHSNGGAHAANNLRCYVLSTISVLCCLLATQWASALEVSKYLVFAAIMPPSIVIFILSPVEDYNKPIDDEEREFHRERGIATLSGCVIACIVFLMFDLLSFGCVIGSVIILTSITMVIGHYKNRILDWQRNKE